MEPVNNPTSDKDVVAEDTRACHLCGNPDNMACDCPLPDDQQVNLVFVRRGWLS